MSHPSILDLRYPPVIEVRFYSRAMPQIRQGVPRLAYVETKTSWQGVPCGHSEPN
jgi:hypothetical protein